MFRLLLALFILTASVFVQAARKATGLSPFQKNVQSCLQDDVDAKKLNTVAKVYQYITEKYALASSEVVGREVLYKVKDESRKLKYENGKLQLFKILEDEDDRLVPVNNEVRQKSLTTEAYLTQLLLLADIRSDWMRTSEKRLGSTQVVITTMDGDIKTLQVEKNLLKKKLDCNRNEGIESCLCADMN